MEKNQYIKPTVKTVAFTVERGFAGTNGPESMTPVGNEEVQSSGNVFGRSSFSSPFGESNE